MDYFQNLPPLKLVAYAAFFRSPYDHEQVIAYTYDDDRRDMELAYVTVCHDMGAKARNNQVFVLTRKNRLKTIVKTNFADIEGIHLHISLEAVRKKLDKSKPDDPFARNYVLTDDIEFAKTLCKTRKDNNEYHRYILRESEMIKPENQSYFVGCLVGYWSNFFV